VSETLWGDRSIDTVASRNPARCFTGQCGVGKNVDGISTPRLRPARTRSAIDDGAEALTIGTLLRRVAEFAERLRADGHRRRYRVGVRIASRHRGVVRRHPRVLTAGAAYVPVDADDPTNGRDGVVQPTSAPSPPTWRAETPRKTTGKPPARRVRNDDAWIIFTSGSTPAQGRRGDPPQRSGVVDAEARLFCARRPIGPGDRVLAGLSCVRRLV